MQADTPLAAIFPRVYDIDGHHPLNLDGPRFCQVSDPYVRELFFADDNKPLPNIVADANTPPVVMLPGAIAMGGSVAAMQPGPPPMAPNYPMMGGMPMGHMGTMAPPSQMGGMGDYPMQMSIPQGEWRLSLALFLGNPRKALGFTNLIL